MFRHAITLPPTRRERGDLMNGMRLIGPLRARGSHRFVSLKVNGVKGRLRSAVRTGGGIHMP